MPQQKYALNFKFYSLIVLMALLICSSVQWVSVYDLESRYQFIFTWSSRSIINQYEFYLLPFLANFMICAIVLRFLSRLLHVEQWLSHTWVYLSITVLAVWMLIGGNGGFMVFDSKMFALAPPVPVLATGEHHLYCQYFALMDNQSLKMELCGRSS